MKYSTKQALLDLSINDSALSVDNKFRLKNDGYCLISISEQQWKKRGIDLELISKVVDDLIKKEGWRGGWDHISHQMKKGKHPEEGAQRLNNLLNKHECFRKIFTIPEVLAAARFLIKDEICIYHIQTILYEF